MKVGSIVKLKQAMLGNSAGTIGVCYEEYNLEGKGLSFIFKNGNYDGFSTEEREAFLEETGFNEKVSTYQFSNVMKLSMDFDSGVFEKALNEEACVE